MTDHERLSAAVQPLLQWYEREARDLPWRRTNDPYAIWISEIMLQQTRVEAVKDYFIRFTQELPTVQALAEVSEERLMKLWEGLGYYTRARNLQKAARILTERFNGKLPASYTALLSLPGIGEYTAGAVASEAFDLPVPAVDGNVLRIMARILEDSSDISDIKIKRIYKEKLREIYPCHDCGKFTQSLMELGATVCIPKGTPKCALCPVSALCKAYQNGTQANLPVKSPKKTRRIEEKTILLLLYGDRVALRKRPGKGLLASLWEFPNIDGFADREQITELLSHWEITPQCVEHFILSRHIFTHVEWKMDSYLIQCPDTVADELVWVTAHELETEFALPSAFRPFRDAWLKHINA